VENVRYMISDAANIVNVESHVLRYWEEELELAIPRNEMGHRYYTEENIAQFQKIKEWKEQGYQLKAIRMMIHNIPEQEVYAVNSMNAGRTGGMMNTEGTGSMMNAGGAGGMMNAGGTGSMMNAGGTPNSQVIQLNREYPGMQQAYVKEHSNSASNTVKLEQFRTMMMGIVKQAVEENNQSLGKEVSLQVGDKVLKEMNYLMREQDEAEEERFRKLDAAIRTQQKGRRFRREKAEKKEKDKKEAKMLKKEEKLNPNLTV
jgi:DNA-binding transcriptional MerR regulator